MKVKYNPEITLTTCREIKDIIEHLDNHDICPTGLRLYQRLPETCPFHSIDDDME